MATGLLRKIFPGIGIEGADPDPVKPVDPNIDPATGKPKVVEDPSDPNKITKPADPLAAFAAIFDNKEPAKPGEEDIPLSVAGVLTEDTLSKLTEKLDFNTFLTQETREALAKGEDPQAIFNAFNEISIGSYKTAMTHSSKLSEQILEDRLTRMEAGLGERINAHHVKSSLSANEIISKSPVLMAGVSMIAERLQKQQPDADPAWITKQATDFFVESAKVLGGEQATGPGDPANPEGPGEGENWLNFAMGDTVNNPGGLDPTDGGDQGAQ